MKNKNMKYIIAGVVVLVVIAVAAAVLVTGNKKKNSEDKMGKTEQSSEILTEQKTENSSELQTEKKTENSSENPEENVITAMYLTYGEENFIFIDTKNGTLFKAPVPEGGLVDKDGKQI
mgnify:CR=1 FL=1